MKNEYSLLAPYGSMKFAGLATKVGQYKIESKEAVQKEQEKASNR
jgi:hypothetical protein